MKLLYARWSQNLYMENPPVTEVRKSYGLYMCNLIISFITAFVEELFNKATLTDVMSDKFIEFEDNLISFYERGCISKFKNEILLLNEYISEIIVRFGKHSLFYNFCVGRYLGKDVYIGPGSDYLRLAMRMLKENIRLHETIRINELNLWLNSQRDITSDLKLFPPGIKRSILSIHDGYNIHACKINYFQRKEYGLIIPSMYELSPVKSSSGICWAISTFLLYSCKNTIEVPDMEKIRVHISVTLRKMSKSKFYYEGLIEIQNSMGYHREMSHLSKNTLLTTSKIDILDNHSLNYYFILISFKDTLVKHGCAIWFNATGSICFLDPNYGMLYIELNHKENEVGMIELETPYSSIEVPNLHALLPKLNCIDEFLSPISKAATVVREVTKYFYGEDNVHNVIFNKLDEELYLTKMFWYETLLKKACYST